MAFEFTKFNLIAVGDDLGTLALISARYGHLWADAVTIPTCDPPTSHAITGMPFTNLLPIEHLKKIQ